MNNVTSYVGFLGGVRRPRSPIKQAGGLSGEHSSGRRGDLTRAPSDNVYGCKGFCRICPHPPFAPEREFEGFGEIIRLPEYSQNAKKGTHGSAMR
jgi:hypothetical protein